MIQNLILMVPLMRIRISIGITTRSTISVSMAIQFRVSLLAVFPVEIVREKKPLSEGRTEYRSL